MKQVGAALGVFIVMVVLGVITSLLWKSYADFKNSEAREWSAKAEYQQNVYNGRVDVIKAETQADVDVIRAESQAENERLQGQLTYAERIATLRVQDRRDFISDMAIATRATNSAWPTILSVATLVTVVFMMMRFNTSMMRVYQLIAGMYDQLSGERMGMFDVPTPNWYQADIEAPKQTGLTILSGNFQDGDDKNVYHRK